MEQIDDLGGRITMEEFLDKGISEWNLHFVSQVLCIEVKQQESFKEFESLDLFFK